jgi:hypothetical protein
MLEIRQEQMQMFLDRARDGFIGRVVNYLKLHRAEHAQGDVASMVRRQITAAEGYGIRSEAAVVKFTELCAVFGRTFTTQASSRKWSASSDSKRMER